MVRRTRFAALVAVLGTVVVASCTAERATPGPPAVTTVAPDADPPPGSPARSPSPGSDPATDPARTLLVSGILEPDGRAMVRLNPAVIVPGEARPPAAGTRGIFAVEVTYRDGSMSRVPFDALIAADAAGGAPEHGFFEVSVPVEGEIVAVRIVDGAGRTTIAELSADEIDR